MHDFSLKKSFSVAKTEYLKWATNSRMIIILVMFVFIKTVVIEPLTERCADINMSLNILEPFISVCNSGLVLLIIPLVYITLISDFPRTDGNTLFFIVRTGKLNWFIGQIIFFFFSVVSFIGSIFIGTTVLILNKGFWGNRWSDVVTRYDKLFPEKAGGFASELITPNLYNHMTPFEAAFKSYLLVILYMFILALILLLFNCLKIKFAGLITAGSVIAIGTALCALKSKYMWYTPMANSIIWIHNKIYFREEIKDITYSYFYFAVLIITLIGISLTCLNKLTYETVQEVDG